MTMRRWFLAAVAGALALAAGAPRAAAQSCGDLLIVLDRSGSMVTCTIGGKTKESMAKEAIKAVIAKYPSMPMGLFVFPDSLKSCSPADYCTPGKTVVDIASDGGSKVSMFLDTMPTSCGGTPTGDSMLVAKDYDKWSTGRKHYVLIITDGQPTCKDGFNDMAMTMPCDGMGYTTNECKYPTKVFDAIKALYDKGVHTFVVGFGGMGSGAGCAGGMPFNPATLDRMAELGGEPQSGPTKFYSATDSKTLLDALDKIGDKVAGGTVGGCAMDGGAAGSGGGGSGGGSGGSGGSGGAAGAAGQGGSGAEGGTTGEKGQPAACACRLDSRPGAEQVVLPVLGLAGIVFRRRR